MGTEQIREGLARGDPAALARAISLVENQRDGYERVLSHVHGRLGRRGARRIGLTGPPGAGKSTLAERLVRSEEHTSELQSRLHLVCRLLLEKKKKKKEQKK